MDFGILLLRMTVGMAMAGHGAQKVFGWFGGPGPDGTGAFMEAMGFRPGRRHALAAGYVELVAGLFLAIGFLTPLAAAMIVSVMIVAAATVHWKNGFFLATNGYEFNLVLGAATLAIAFTGPGTFSLDSAIGFTPSGAGWGVGATLLAVLGAIGQLAQRHTAPAIVSGHAEAAPSPSAHAQ
jgi:putative oxidoreductase